MKILCILYDDPKGGMPKSYPLSDLPKLEKYPDGMTLPSPKGRVKMEMDVKQINILLMQI